jgi:ornithine--oxo-acid transaminase
VQKNMAKVVVPRGVYCGRSIHTTGSTTDKIALENFGPFDGSFVHVNYDDTPDLEEKFKADSNICAFIVEPVQGEAGIYVPADDYLKKCQDLCTKYNVLFIADEV